MVAGLENGALILNRQEYCLCCYNCNLLGVSIKAFGKYLASTYAMCVCFAYLRVIANAKTIQTMIAKGQNKALLTVGNEALKNADWADYAKYCFDREKGLRKEAFKHLDKFLKSTEAWNLEKKIDFVKFLFPFFENLEEADYGPFPQPLSDKLVKPTLTTWCDKEQIDNNPFRWFGKYYRSEEHLFKALEINPTDDLARQTILSW